MSDAVRWVERISGGPGTVRRRLEQAGTGTPSSSSGPSRWCGACWGWRAGAVAAALIGAQPRAGRAADGGRRGHRRARRGPRSRPVPVAPGPRREERMMQEFPTIAELLALSVGAGRGRSVRWSGWPARARGSCPVELRRTLAAARAGASLVAGARGPGRAHEPAAARPVRRRGGRRGGARHPARRGAALAGAGRPRARATAPHGERRAEGDRDDGPGCLPRPAGHGRSSPSTRAGVAGPPAVTRPRARRPARSNCGRAAAGRSRVMMAPTPAAGTGGGRRTGRAHAQHAGALGGRAAAEDSGGTGGTCRAGCSSRS